VTARNYDFKRIENYSDQIRCLTGEMEVQGLNYAKRVAEINKLKKEISDLKR